MSEPIYLGTVAIEPNRWGVLDPSRAPVADPAAHLDAIAAAGFDGIELWDGHCRGDLVQQASDAGVPVRVFNSYVSFDGDDDTARASVAAQVRETGASAVKMNVGNDPDAEDAYAARLAAFADAVGENVQVLCECHDGISIAEDPDVAARIFDAAAPPERLGAIVHTHDGPRTLAAKFAAYGERIAHVHVNHLDFATMTHPTLRDAEPRLRETVGVLRSLGFAGTWTLEFVAGVMTERDRADQLVAQAVIDLPVLRDVLGS